MRTIPARSILAVMLLLVVSLAAPRARATPPDDDPPSLAPLAERSDADPHALWTDGPSGSLWVSIAATLALRSQGERDAGAMLVIGVPFDRVARPSGSSTRSAALADPSSRSASSEARPDPRPQEPGAPVPSPAGAAPASKPPAPASKPPALLAFPSGARDASARVHDAEPSAPGPIVILITPQVARAAVNAATRHAGLETADQRLDALASRARTSALLPELRVRATRLVDEAQSLAPTEYDASRTTATGGESLWLEARATWSLDRLVFADEEIAIERMRNERAEARARVTSRTLELLFGWQRAVAQRDDPARSPEDQLDAALKAAEHEAALDVITAGWFTKWQRAQPAAPRASP